MAPNKNALERIEKLQTQLKHAREANKKLRTDRDFLLQKFNEKREEREEMIKEMKSLWAYRDKVQEELARKEQTILMMREEVARGDTYGPFDLEEAEAFLADIPYENWVYQAVQEPIRQAESQDTQTVRRAAATMGARPV